MCIRAGSSICSTGFGEGEVCVGFFVCFFVGIFGGFFLFDWMVGFVCMYLNCDRKLH